MTVSENVAAWPLEGKVVYYGPVTISERCLVPAHLYDSEEDGYLTCDRYPSNQIFRFTEAIAGIKIELNFRGKTVTGKWYSGSRNLGNDTVSEILLDGKRYFRRAAIGGGKYDEGTIIGTRKGKLIRAKANSEGHDPHLGYVRIELLELNDVGRPIQWKRVQNLKLHIGYMPARERLLISLESLLEEEDRSSPPAVLGPCPLPREMRAAPAAGCVKPTSSMR